MSQTLISDRYPQVLGAMRRVFKDVGGVGRRASAHSLGSAPQDHPGLLARVAAPYSLPITIALFAAAFVVLAWPWLSGAVTIPWDAKSQFFPALQFLATSIAQGEWPWWSPNVFAGWPMIADPQSLLCSPLHVAWALLHPAIGLHAFDVLTFAYLFLGGLGIILFFHDRGWHPAGALVAALAFAFGASASARIQHTIQIVSLSYLPVALWLVARALERSSWRTGVAAGLVIGLLAVGRDQVALLSLYVIAGFVLAHWLIGPAPLRRMRASLAAVCAAGLTAFFIAIVPVVLSALLAARSNRPEIDFASAAAGSLHPVHLLQFVFADLFGAMSPDVEYWAPQSAIWDTAWGSPGLFLSQNMGLLYAGALTFAVVIACGVLRGLAWTREIRFFSIATVLLLLYAVGAYTPAFELMYEVLPGVTLFRRPADATFVVGALYALIAGYLVHCWLAERVPAASSRQRVAEIACAAILVAGALWLAHSVVGVSLALVPVLTALAFTVAAVGVLVLARRVNRTAPILATAFIAAFMTADLGWNNAPHISTALPPGQFEALAQGTQNETVRLLKAKLGEAAAPDRRDRVELIGIAYHWPNLSLAQDFDHVFGHNPLRLRRFHDATHVGDTVAIPSQRTFSPLYPSYRSAFADLLGVRFVATGVPVEEIDASLHSGDLNLVARTKDAYVYENPRALPRLMLMTDWRIADFDEVVRSGWPALDPARTVLLQHPPSGVAASSSNDGHARLLRYANTEVAIQADAPAQGGVLLLNDVWHPWWRATVDGWEAEILKANVIFRGVAVPPGTHIVRFTFHPFTGAWDELMGKFKQGCNMNKPVSPPPVTRGEEHWTTKGKNVRLFLWNKYARDPSAAIGRILFVHGSSMASQPTFDLQVPGGTYISAMEFFARRGYDTWCVDVEGYGRSTKDRDNNAPIACGADDCFAAASYIQTVRGKEPLLIYGISSGALRAALFAQRHPDMVARLALDAMVWTGKNSPTLSERRKRLPEFRASNRRPIDRKFIRSIFERDHPGTADDAVIEAFAAAILALDDSVPTGTYVDMCANLPVCDPEKIRMPVLIMRGEYDGIASMDDLLEFFAKLPNPDKQFAVMPGIAHASFHQKNYGLCYHILASFFAQPSALYRA